MNKLNVYVYFISFNGRNIHMYTVPYLDMLQVMFFLFWLTIDKPSDSLTLFKIKNYSFYDN